MIEPPVTSAGAVALVATGDRREEARGLARRFGFVLVDETPVGLHLRLSADGLCLTGPLPTGRAALSIDYARGALRRRIQAESRRRSPLLRALGCPATGEGGPRIFDATFGLGRDGFTLAAAGATVVGVERSAVIVALVDDARARAIHDPAVQTWDARVDLRLADARHALHAGHADDCDAVYLDPMFPPRTSAAQVKKDMALLHTLFAATPQAGGAHEVRALWEAARRRGVGRIVVKRPRGAPPVADGVSHRVDTKAARFDVYLMPRGSR